MDKILLWQGLLIFPIAPVVYTLVFLNGFVPKKIRAWFKEFECGLVSMYMYVAVVYMNYVFREWYTGDWVNWVLGFMAILFSVLQIDLFRTCLRVSYSEHFRKRMGFRMGIFTVNMFLMVLMSATMINYISYALWPRLYAVPEGLNHAEVAFEFFHYSFMLMLTFNGASIEPVHVISKIFQMIEIILFFVYVGIFLTDLFFKLKNPQEVEKEEVVKKVEG